MYYLKKRIEISASHKLNLNYPSKCENLHGHNWIITVYCKSDKLNSAGMIVDFGLIKNKVMTWDHENLNNRIEFDENSGRNPTAENIAQLIYYSIPHCYKVTVQESEGNEVTYEMVTDE